MDGGEAVGIVSIEPQKRWASKRLALLKLPASVATDSHVEFVYTMAVCSQRFALPCESACGLPSE